VDVPKIRKETEELFRSFRMRIEITPAARWGFWIEGAGHWRPTRKMAVAKATRILQSRLLDEQRQSERFTVSEADLD